MSDINQRIENQRTENQKYFDYIVDQIKQYNKVLESFGFDESSETYIDNFDLISMIPFHCRFLIPLSDRMADAIGEVYEAELYQSEYADLKLNKLSGDEYLDSEATCLVGNCGYYELSLSEYKIASDKYFVIELDNLTKKLCRWPLLDS